MNFKKIISVGLLLAVPLAAQAQLFGGGQRCGLLCQVVTGGAGWGGGGGSGGTTPPGGGDNSTTTPPPPPDIVQPGGDNQAPPDQEVANNDPSTGGGEGNGDPANNPDYEGTTPNIENPQDQGSLNNDHQSASRLVIAMGNRSVETHRGANPQMSSHWRAEVATNRRGDAAGSLLVANDGSNIPSGAYSGLASSYYTDLANCSQCMEQGCSAKGVVMNGACACDRTGDGIPYQCDVNN